MAHKKVTRPKWYDSRPGAAGLWLTAWLVAFYLGIQALSTGNNWLYLLTLAVGWYGFNRLIKTIWPAKGNWLK